MGMIELVLEEIRSSSREFLVSVSTFFVRTWPFGDERRYLNAMTLSKRMIRTNWNGVRLLPQAINSRMPSGQLQGS